MIKFNILPSHSGSTGLPKSKVVNELKWPLGGAEISPLAVSWSVQQAREKSPVLLWLQGGPGGTSMFGLFVEHGPYVVHKNLTGESCRINKNKPELFVVCAACCFASLIRSFSLCLQSVWGTTRGHQDILCCTSTTRCVVKWTRSHWLLMSVLSELRNTDRFFFLGWNRLQLHRRWQRFCSEPGWRWQRSLQVK